MAFRYGKKETQTKQQKPDDEEDALKRALSALDRANKQIRQWHLNRSTASGNVGAEAVGKGKLRGVPLSKEEELAKRRQLNKAQRSKMQDWEN
jgi:hypothetical protein